MEEEAAELIVVDKPIAVDIHRADGQGEELICFISGSAVSFHRPIRAPASPVAAQRGIAEAVTRIVDSNGRPLAHPCALSVAVRQIRLVATEIRHARGKAAGPDAAERVAVDAVPLSDCVVQGSKGREEEAQPLGHLLGCECIVGLREIRNTKDKVDELLLLISGEAKGSRVQIKAEAG